MHHQPIRGLEARLERLAIKEGVIGPCKLIDDDRASTTTRLAFLRGIEARNHAWSLDAPRMAAQDDAQSTRRREIMESIQFTTRDAQQLAKDDAHKPYGPVIPLGYVTREDSWMHHGRISGLIQRLNRLDQKAQIAGETPAIIRDRLASETELHLLSGIALSHTPYAGPRLVEQPIIDHVAEREEAERLRDEAEQARMDAILKTRATRGTRSPRIPDTQEESP